MNIEVKIEKNDKSIDIYVFTVLDTTAVFTGFHKQYKPEDMKVWKTQVLWNKYNERDSQTEEPELTDVIRKLAFEEMIKIIRINNWKEYKGVK